MYLCLSGRFENDEKSSKNMQKTQKLSPPKSKKSESLSVTKSPKSWGGALESCHIVEHFFKVHETMENCLFYWSSVEKNQHFGNFKTS